MMKKLLLLTAGICCALTFASCDKKSEDKKDKESKEIVKPATPGEKMIDIIEDATKQVKKAKSQEDLDKVLEEIFKKSSALEKEYPDFKPTEEDQKAIEKAGEKFGKAYERKAKELREQEGSNELDAMEVLVD